MDYKIKLKQQYLSFKSLEDRYLTMERELKNSMIGKTINYEDKLWTINCYSDGVLELEDVVGEILCEHIDNVFE